MDTKKKLEDIETKEEIDKSGLNIRLAKSKKFQDQSWIGKISTEGVDKIDLTEPVNFEELTETIDLQEHQDNYETLLNIKVNLSVDVGHFNMQLSDLTKLSQGTVVETSRLNNENFTLSINEKWIAEGDIVKKGDVFGFRILKILDPKKRLIALSSLK